jgi:hypothetical protein
MSTEDAAAYYADQDAQAHQRYRHALALARQRGECPPDPPDAPRQWAIDVAADELTEWRP